MDATLRIREKEGGPADNPSRFFNKSGIKGLNERSFQNGVAKMSVDSKNNAQIISDELSLKDFGTFSVEVMSSTANQLELRVVPK